MATPLTDTNDIRELRNLCHAMFPNVDQGTFAHDDDMSYELYAIMAEYVEAVQLCSKLLTAITKPIGSRPGLGTIATWAVQIITTLAGLNSDQKDAWEVCRATSSGAYLTRIYGILV